MTSTYACDVNDQTEEQIPYPRKPACVVKGQTDVQIPYTSTPLNLPVMPKSILKYICQAKNTSQDQKIREQT